MTKRVPLPGASELFFRSTTSSVGLDDVPAVEGGAVSGTDGAEQERLGAGALGPAVLGSNGKHAGAQADQKAAVRAAAPARRGSPRRKHDSKITVYVSREELLALEQARLDLRGTHHLAVDRGRLVREAVAVLLADFEAHGEESVLVQRLRMDADDESAVDEPSS